MYNNELYHHGVLGMKWGVRRYQPYPSGSKKGKEVGEAAKAGSNQKTSSAASIRKQQKAEKKKERQINSDLRKLNWSWASVQGNSKLPGLIEQYRKDYPTQASLISPQLKISSWSAKKAVEMNQPIVDQCLKNLSDLGVNLTTREKLITDGHMSFIGTEYVRKLGYEDSLSHSAKGSTWEEHKYIKRINGLYYYPDSYEGGRHLSDEQKENMAVDIDELTEDDIEKLADEVIKGNFGNGQQRKEALGAHYQTVQDRVNQKLKSGGSSSSSSKSDSSSKGSSKKEDSKTSTTKTTKKAKGIDLDSVYSVYDRQAERDKDKKKKTTSTQKRDKSSRTPTKISEKRR